MELTYYGVSAFHIKLDDGRGILIDPYIKESGLTVSDIPRTDFVFLSHGAFDHIGSAFDIIKRDQAPLFAPPDVYEYAKIKHVILPLGGQTLISGVSETRGTIKIKAVWASHLSFIRAGGNCFITGQPVGFIITLPDGLKLYHMGDTSLFSDLKMIGDLYQPDIVTVPVGRFQDAVTFLDPEEAAIAVEWIHPKMAIPVHYHLEKQRENPEIFAADLSVRSPGTRVRVMRPGEKIVIGMDMV